MRRSLIAIGVVAASSLGASVRNAPSNPVTPAPAQTTAAPTQAATTQQSSSVPARPQTPQVAEGARLFVAYNCGDCHGAGGSGAMGPSLQDNRWRYGGTPSQVFRSIVEGRPDGMPAWGAILSGSETQSLVAYLIWLGEGKDLTTENFTGATIERSGH